MLLRVVALALLGACSPTESTCSGGGDPSVAIGVEEVVGEFVPYEDGDPVPVADDGGPGLEFAFEIGGLDASEPVGVVLRLSRPGEGTTDYLANANLRCTDPGPARYGASAPWPATWPEPSLLDGTPITVGAVFTDVHGVSAEVSIDLVVEATP